MAQLRRDYQSFVERDAEVLVLGPEGKSAFATYWEQNELPFTGLPDLDHSVLKLYGQEIKLFKFGRMPAQVIVDKAGVVQFVHYGHGMEDIPPNEEVLQLIDEI
jgi:peroxiredoxin